MLNKSSKAFLQRRLPERLAELEYHCHRLHSRVMQLDGELAADGALIVHATTFVDWPPGSGPHRHNWQDTPLGHVRVWGTLQDGVFMLHSYDAVTHVVPSRPMRIRLDGGLLSKKGRRPRPPDPKLIESILQWMRDRLDQGARPDDLTEGAYVLYRWPERYEDKLLEGQWALLRIIDTPDRRRKRPVESGARYLRTKLKGLYDWPTLLQLATTNE